MTLEKAIRTVELANQGFPKLKSGADYRQRVFLTAPRRSFLYSHYRDQLAKPLRDVLCSWGTEVHVPSCQSQVTIGPDYSLADRFFSGP